MPVIHYSTFLSLSFASASWLSCRVFLGICCRLYCEWNKKRNIRLYWLHNTANDGLDYSLFHCCSFGPSSHLPLLRWCWVLAEWMMQLYTCTTTHHVQVFNENNISNNNESLARNIYENELLSMLEYVGGADCVVRLLFHYYLVWDVVMDFRWLEIIIKRLGFHWHSVIDSGPPVFLGFAIVR